MEREGHRPLLVEGADDNLKITTASDLDWFAHVLSRRQTEPS
jgi:2-C-methyl-D-erythritol 4-phosphate cytidylyltransferase